MSRASSDDQVRFLLSCVKHSNNGRVDFVEVAKECGVVSKGAAAKRYERLLKANPINPTAESPASSDGLPAPKSSTVKSKPKDSTEKAVSKKRKADRDESPNAGEAGDEKRLNASMAHSFAGQPALHNSPLAPPMYMQRPPQMLHGIPQYGAPPRPGYPGYPPPFAHQMSMPDMPMYPPFGPGAFRDHPWAMAMGPPDAEFEEYLNHEYVSQQQPGLPPAMVEPLSLKVPPAPQEVVPAEPEERQSQEKEKASEPLEGVVVVE